MRKYVVGAIAGALIVFAGQAAAESVSKIGKKVQAEFIVKVDGKELETMGLSIDGQTTVPARSLANAVGYDVAFVNKEVILTKKEDEKVTETTNESVVTPDPIEEPKYTLESITFLIESRENELKTKKRMFDTSVEFGASQDEITKGLAAIKEMEDELANLKAIKAELESKQ